MSCINVENVEKHVSICCCCCYCCRQCYYCCCHLLYKCIVLANASTKLTIENVQLAFGFILMLFTAKICTYVYIYVCIFLAAFACDRHMLKSIQFICFILIFTIYFLLRLFSSNLSISFFNIVCYLPSNSCTFQYFNIYWAKIECINLILLI